MSFTITTWNVQNFAKSDPNFAPKLDFLVATLSALDPDVIALQEILDANALGDLAARLGYHQSVATPDGRGNRVAVLTRNPPALPPQEILAWRLPAGVTVQEVDGAGNVVAVPQPPRPALRVTVRHAGADVEVITVHLKSKLLTFPGGFFSTADESLRARVAYFALQRRAAEAATVREEVTPLLAAGKGVVVLGDLNDGPDAATTQILYGASGSQPRGPEDATRTAGAFQRQDAADAQRLFNVVKFAPEATRWSRKHEGQPELLDHILASAALMPRVGPLRLVPTIQILNDDTPNLVGSPTTSGVVPDHAPVTATFQI